MKSERILGVVGHLAINETHTVQGVREYCGGAGYHVAFGAGLVGSVTAELISRCGGDFDLSGLRRLGIALGGVIVEAGKSDRFVIEEKAGGEERTFRAVGNMAGRVRIESGMLEEVGWIHLATAPPEQQARWLDFARMWGVPTSVDSFELFVQQGPERVREVFARADLVFANESEWSGVDMQMADLKGDLVLKRGSKGAAYYRRGELVAQVAAPKVKVVDTTGAGEILAGAFLGLRLKGGEVGKALERACELASWSIEDFGVDHLLNKLNLV